MGTASEPGGGGGHGPPGQDKTPLPVTIGVVACWYACNILVVLGNKYLLSHTGFNKPVFLTLSHMTACVLMGAAASIAMPLKPLKSGQQTVKVGLLAFIFCSTILLGNASLQYLPVSFNQAVGATTPFFTALLAYGLQGARESFLTYLALVPVMGGVVVASGGEPLFHVLGFIFCISATAGRALKTVVQSILMTDPAEKLDPMSLLFYMSAFCSAMLVPTVLIMEPTAWREAVTIYNSNNQFLWWMLANAALAYMTNLLNFLVTKCTSALTLQVLGNAKGVVAAGVSVLVFRNVVTAQGALGYLITLTGVFLYSTAKKRFKVDSSAKDRERDQRHDSAIKEWQRALLSPRAAPAGGGGGNANANGTGGAGGMANGAAGGQDGDANGGMNSPRHHLLGSAGKNPKGGGILGSFGSTFRV